MIRVTRLDGRELFLNPDLIEHFEATPETVITLRDGGMLVVREGAQELSDRVLHYRQQVARGPLEQPV